MTTQDLIDSPFVLLVLGGLGAFALMWAKDQIEVFTHRTNRIEERTDRRAERTEDREAEHLGDISTLRANVDLLMGERGKCDALSNQVAVLQDFKGRAETKFNDVDDARRELAGVTEQIKTLFSVVGEIKQDIGNVPQAVLSMLRSQTPPSPQRAANG